MASALKAERAKGGGSAGDIGSIKALIQNQRATYNSDNELWTETEVAVSKSVQNLLAVSSSNPELDKHIKPHLKKLMLILETGKSIINNSEQSVNDAEALIKKLGG